MADLVTSFLEAAGTYRILEDRGVRVRSHERGQQVQCPDPGCQCAAHVVGRSIVCTGKRCTWRAGNVVDYVARLQGLGVKQVLSELHETYPDRLGMLNGVVWSGFVDPLLSELERNRALLDFLISHAQQTAVTTPEIALTLEWLEAQEIDTTASHTCFLLNKEACLELAELVSDITGEKCEYSREGGSWVIPFWSDFVSVSHIHLTAMQPHPGRGLAERWDVNPTRVAFSGLWECRGGEVNDSVFVSGVLSAASLAGDAHAHARSRNFLGVYVSPTARTELNLRLARACYLLDDDESLRKLAEIKNITASDGLVVGYIASPEVTLPWMRFLAQRLNSKLSKSGNDEAAKRDLEAFTMNAEERREWGELLELLGLERVAKFVKTSANNIDRVYHVRGAVIKETDAGYMVAKGRAEPAKATNFTVSLERNIYFPGSSDVYHQGTVRINAQEHPAIFSSAALAQPQQLVSAARLATSSRRRKDDPVPMVQDKMLAMSLVLHFGAQVSALPKIEGVQRLGWSQDRRRFDSVSWCIFDGKVVPRETTSDPSLTILNHFDFRLRTLSAEIENQLRIETPPQWAAEMLAQLVAHTARVHRSRPAHPLVFLDTPNQRRALKEIFSRAFGQSECVQLNYNQRAGFRDIDVLHGHPCLATGMLPRAGAQSCPLPFFLLTDSGAVVDTSESFDLGVAFIARGFADVMHWLITTEAAQLQFRQSALYEQDLLLEGTDILRLALGYTLTAELPEHPALHAALRGLPAHQVGTVFRQHFNDQRLLVKMAAFDETLRPLVTAEFGRADSTFLAGEFGSLDLVTGQALLEAAYRVPVKIPEAKQKQYTEETWDAEAVGL